MIIRKIIPYRIVLLRRKLKPIWKLITKQNLKKKDAIPILHIHLTDHCNLKCSGCDNFSPLAPEVFADIAVVDRDLKRISELCDNRVREIQLLGGEPLLHPKIIDFLNITKKYFTRTTVKLISNGVLITRMEDDFWESCRQNKIEIVVTKYPININHAEIERLVKSKKVKFSFYGSTEDIEKSMQCMPIDLSGKQNPRDSFLRCSAANRCIALDNGKIYTCTTIPYIKYFNSWFGKDLKVSENDYLNIYKVERFDEIMKFLCRPMPFCRYCNQKAMIWNIGFGVSKKEIEEWTGKNKIK
jgi:MoaA/NifB/PqqE/SkfB family radical SAM enzyme